MATFKKCPPSVSDLALRVMERYLRHQPLIDAGVTVDFVFAYPTVDDLGNVLSPALSKNGVQAIGICRKLSLKDRAMGRGDAEISLDGSWWDDATDAERQALLDHELYHIVLKTTKKQGREIVLTDDLNRPALAMRPHDFEVGWFHCIAKDHGIASAERKQAQQLMDDAGQFYWPELSFAEGSRMSKLEVSQQAA